MSAALAAAALLLAILAGPAAASESPGALRDPFVGPRVGTPATLVRFSVTYRNSDETSTAHVKVVIDGVARAMAPTPGGSTAFGVRYRFSTSLRVGMHVVVFIGADGSASDILAAGTVRIHTVSGVDPATHPGSALPTSRPAAGPGGDTQSGGKPSGDADGTTAPTKTPPATPAPGATGGTHDGAGSPPDSATGGTQATHDDASGAADHPTSGPAGGPASGGSPVGAPPTAGADTGSGGANGVPSATSTPDGLALGATGTPAGGSGGGSGGSGPRLDDRTLTLLTGNGHDIPAATRMLIAAISTTTTTTAVVAFFVFGKRRRDGEPPAPDEVLAANAGRFSNTPASTLVPVGSPAGAGLLDEAGIPRWRRPSLIQARKTDPRYSAVIGHDRLAFDHRAGSAAAGVERRLIRYRAVSLLDAPDPLRSTEIGDLDEGDEVQLLERSGGYWLVLCPDGSRGWVHRMTLGDVVTDEGEPDGSDAARRSSPTGSDAREVTDGLGEAAGSREADRSIGEDGTDFLADYLRRARGA